MRYLSVCSIIKNEGRYLEEWLTFHKIVGVEHFYLFDNNSTDNTKEVLQPFIKSGFVTYIPWRAHPGQILAYEYALRSFGDETKWMAFIDADEFLHGIHENDLRKIIADYEDFSCLAVHWKIFGTSNHLERPQGFVIENYVLRAIDNFSPNGHPKSIVKMSEGLRPKDPHTFFTKNGTVNEAKELLNITQQTVQKQWTCNRIAINHYFTKSREDWLEKMKRGRATLDTNHPDHIRKESIFESHNRNDIKDETILRFLPELKAELEKEKILAA